PPRVRAEGLLQDAGVFERRQARGPRALLLHVLELCRQAHPLARGSARAPQGARAGRGQGAAARAGADRRGPRLWQNGVVRARLERPRHPLLSPDRCEARQGVDHHAAQGSAAQAAGAILPGPVRAGTGQHGSGGWAVFGDYDAKSFFDEVFEPDGTPRRHYGDIVQRIRSLSSIEFGRRRALADLTFRNQGITFTVYGDESGTERTFPFDLLPRVIPAAEWAHIEAGLIQRVPALN